MGHIEIDLMVNIVQIGMTRSEMAGFWILRIREVMDIGSILVLVLKDTMIVIIIILTGGVTRDIFQMSSRNRSHLHLMGI